MMDAYLASFLVMMIPPIYFNSGNGLKEKNKGQER